MNPYLIIWLLFTHWCGDFVAQSNSMALGKSSSNRWLSLHVVIYAATLATGAALFNGVSILLGAHAFGVAAFAAFVILNGALHWITDWHTSRWSARLWKAERRHDFFVAIGADQFVCHCPALILTAHWLLS